MSLQSLLVNRIGAELKRERKLSFARENHTQKKLFSPLSAEQGAKNKQNKKFSSFTVENIQTSSTWSRPHRADSSIAQSRDESKNPILRCNVSSSHLGNAAGRVWWQGKACKKSVCASVDLRRSSETKPQTTRSITRRIVNIAQLFFPLLSSCWNSNCNIKKKCLSHESGRRASTKTGNAEIVCVSKTCET